MQWRIQDFPGGGTNFRWGCANLLFCKLLLKTAWKWKNLDVRPWPPAPLDPPLPCSNIMILTFESTSGNTIILKKQMTLALRGRRDNDIALTWPSAQCRPLCCSRCSVPLSPRHCPPVSTGSSPSTRARRHLLDPEYKNNANEVAGR